MLITIFTPLYNRAEFLSEICKSLKLQEDNAIEWLIVDDGSKDNPKAIVDTLSNNSNLEIRFYSQKNKGKHFAINKGLELAKGEIFIILDSDDKLPENALKTIRFYYSKIKDNPKIAGVAGRRNFKNGDIVGNQNFSEIISNSVDIRHKHKVTGDLVEIFKTDVFREFKFPEIENEKFCPEVLNWNRIAQKYNLLFFNKGIYTTQYLDGGLTDKIVKIRMTSPIASMLTYSELGSYKIPFPQKIKACINFWRFSFNSTKQFSQKWKMMSSWFSIVALPLGYLLFLRDKNNHNTTQG